jgi:hypothetical protein
VNKGKKKGQGCYAPAPRLCLRGCAPLALTYPDRMSALGPEFRELAERKMKEINAANEELRPDKQAQRP